MDMSYLHKSWKIILLISIISAFALTLSAQFGGGQGTEDDPWQIARPDDLDEIRNYLGEEHNDKYYVQILDIDLGVAPWNEDEGWVPIGSSAANSFQGHYDGRHHRITNLTINRTHPGGRYQALFGYTGGGSTIKNTGLVDVDINGTTSTPSFIGGIAGYLSNTTVINCFVTGDIRGGHLVGGIAGIDANSSYEKCFTAGSVTGTSNNVGGISGFTSDSNIRDSYSRMDVRGNQNSIGGLVGDLRGDSFVTRSYSTGSVSASHNIPGTIGGLVGSTSGAPAVNDSYWNTETSGQEESVRGEGRLTRQMIYPYDETTYVGWDFEEIWEHDVEEEINDGYPLLFYQVMDPPVDLDPPVVSIEFIEIEGQKHCRLSWQPVEEAQSYKIYASDDPDTEDWGEAIAHTEETVFVHPANEEPRAFYYVTALTEEAP